MRCPVCETKIKENQYVCDVCGTKVSDINNASYEDAVEILNKGNLLQKERIFYSTKIPENFNWKKFTLLTIFLGYLGIHNIFAGKKKLGFSQMVCFIVAEILGFLSIKGYIPGITTIVGLLFAFPVICWILDIFNVCFKRYKFPYVINKK